MSNICERQRIRLFESLTNISRRVMDLDDEILVQTVSSIQNTEAWIKRFEEQKGEVV